MSPVTPLTTIGHPTPRIDALERVTGKATYTLDVKLPGMLYARVLRSPLRGDAALGIPQHRRSQAHLLGERLGRLGDRGQSSLGQFDRDGARPAPHAHNRFPPLVPWASSNGAQSRTCPRL